MLTINFHLIFFAAGAFVPAAPLWAGDPYGQLAREVARSAEHGGARRVAVIPFTPTGRPDKEGGMILAERLVSSLAGEVSVQIVERTFLDRVLEEQKLGALGLVDPRQAREVGRLLGVDAIVTGTFISLANHHVEVHARVIDSSTARVLGAATARIDKEWDDDPMPVGALWGVEAPDPRNFPAPLVRLVPDPFRDSPNDGSSCSGWEGEVDKLQQDTVDLKARLWAGRMSDPAFSMRSVTKNPGSEIRSLSARQRFYELVRRYHERGTDPLGRSERDSLDAVEKRVGELLEKCY